MKMKILLLRRLFCALVALAAVLETRAQPAPVTASATGELSGDVSHAVTKAALDGAVVELVGTNRKTLTDSSGQFTFRNLPPGDYAVAVSYTGLDSVTSRAQVSTGSQARLPVQLTSGLYTLEAFSVTAEREGNAAAITRQRNASNMINVVALDAYGDIADGNIGNFIRKLPGVATQNAEGDIVGVMLRGAPPSMSMISLDGTQLTAAAASNTGTVGDRAPLIDRLPAEFIKEIEVTKASRPDMDATGLGGAAKLVTKSAFDFKENLVATYRAGINRNTYRDENGWTPNASFTLMKKFGPEDKFAATASASYAKTIVTRDRVQLQHIDPIDISTGHRQLDDTYTRVRKGGGFKLEYRPDRSLSLYADTLVSWYLSDTKRFDYNAASTGGRRVADYNIVSRAAIEAGAAPLTTARLSAGVAPGATSTLTELLAATWNNRNAIDVRTDPQRFIAVGGTKKIGDWEISARGTYSYEKYDRSFEQFSGTLPNVGFKIDQVQSQARPLLTQTYGPSITNWALYNGQMTKQMVRNRDYIESANLDVTRTFAGDRLRGLFKAGAKYQRQERQAWSYNPVWDYIGADGFIGTNNGTRVSDDNLAQFLRADNGYGLFDGAFPSYQRLDYAGKVKPIFDSTPNFFRPNGTSVSARPPPGRAVEEVAAGYAMAKVDYQRASLLTGVRGEQTEIEATGAVNRSGVFSTTTRDGDYRKYFPSAHLRYDATKNLVLRASYSTTMARPGIADIIPTTTITGPTGAAGVGVVQQNNANLGPQMSKNYDLMAEYYFNPVGVLSAGIYRKNVTGFIASYNSVIDSGADNGFDGQFAGYTLSSKRNLTNATINGYEFSYDQQLRWLPKPFNSLALFANYTHIKTEGTYDNGAAALANFVPTSYNWGLSYTFRRLQVRVAMNHLSPYLLQFSPDPIAAVWQTETDTLSLNANYKLTRWVNLSAGVENLFNEWPHNYSLNRNRLTVIEVYGTRWTFGVNGRF